jgi:hypothetical protein
MANTVVILLAFAAQAFVVASETHDFAWCRNDDSCPLTSKDNPTSGACSARDRSVINKIAGGHGDSSWGKTISDCGHSALNMFFGVNQGTFNKCLESKVTISNKCSTCYAKMAEYDFENCKFKCLFSWCSSACMNCNKGSDLISCIGFVDPQPTTCDSSESLLVDQFLSPNAIAVAFLGFIVGSGVTFVALRARSNSPTANEVPLLTA